MKPSRQPRDTPTGAGYAMFGPGISSIKVGKKARSVVVSLIAPRLSGPAP